MDKVQSGFTNEDYSQPDIEPMSWQASEFIHHQKKANWYVAFGLVVVLLIALAVWTRQWLSIAVFIAMAGALLTYANKQPRVLEYQIDSRGLRIGQKFYAYSQFRSFSVISDVGWHTIELDPTQRFMPRLTILFDNKDFDKIVSLLAAELPRVDRRADWIEQITRKLKF